MKVSIELFLTQLASERINDSDCLGRSTFFDDKNRAFYKALTYRLHLNDNLNLVQPWQSRETS